MIGDYDSVLDEDVIRDYPRTLPQLGHNDGRFVSERDVDEWMASRDARVEVVKAAVLDLGVDAVVAALEDLGVLADARYFLDD
jgi:hypothetical protein